MQAVAYSAVSWARGPQPGEEHLYTSAACAGPFSSSAGLLSPPPPAADIYVSDLACAVPESEYSIAGS